MKTFRKSPLFYPLICACLSMIVIMVLQCFLDLEALYGPGGVKSIAALSENYSQRDWTTWLMALLLPMTGGNILYSARLVMLLGCASTVFTLSLFAEKLYGKPAAAFVGIGACFYAPICWLGVLIGADSPAMGFAYFGIGIALLGTHLRIGFIPLMMLGGFFSFFGAKIKIIALPVVALFAILPFFQKKIRSVVSCAFFLGSILLFLRTRMLPAQDAHIGQQSQLSMTKILQKTSLGFENLHGLFQLGDVLPQLMFLAVLGLLLSPEKRWLKAMLFGITIAAMSYTAAVLGEKLRTRYLIPISLPFLILGLGWIGERLKNGVKSMPFWGLATVILFSFVLDNLAFFHQWSQLFVHREGAKPFQLPYPPKAYLHRYHNLSPLDHSDHSAIGIRDLFRLAQKSPSAGAATVPLRDGREFHLRAATGVLGKPYRIIEKKWCCRSQESEDDCIAKVIGGMELSGGRLILPLIRSNSHRIPKQHSRWTQKLITKAQQHANWKQHGLWWGYFDGSGRMGKMPCTRRNYHNFQ